MPHDQLFDQYTYYHDIITMIYDWITDNLIINSGVIWNITLSPCKMHAEIRISESCSHRFERLSSISWDAAAQTARQIIQKSMHQTETDYELPNSGVLDY